MTTRRHVFLSLIAALLLPSAAAARTYPSRPITFVVPFAPGEPSSAGFRAIRRPSRSDSRAP